MKALCPDCGIDCRNATNLASHIKSKHPNYLGTKRTTATRKNLTQTLKAVASKFAARKASRKAVSTTAAERARESRAAWSRRASASVREIGPLPEVADPARRERCRLDLQLFCETYLSGWFTLAWSQDHLRCIGRLESTVLKGGQHAYAMPRGTGKTSLAIAAALWAILFGHRHFIVLIGATQEAATEELMDAIKVEIETNPLLAADFPEVCHPINSLDGINSRGSGQTLDGERTRIVWKDDRVVLPTVRGAKSSGSVVRALGLTGRLRGLSHTTADNRKVRPDLVILDDPQTDESAASPSQNVKRLRIISRAVLGLAGPRKRIAAIMPCTVIAPGDMVDRVLDRDQFPQWNGERTKLIYDLPTNTDLWDRYAEIYRAGLLNGQGVTPATEFYQSHRAEMDAGARVAWAERYEPGEVSAVQYAMNLRIKDYRAFMAEYQNDPDKGLPTGLKELIPASVAGRLSGTGRFQVPAECTRLTVGIDCSPTFCHWFVVVAWTELGGGVVIDCGAWPNQSRGYFAAADARPSLVDAYPGHTDPQRVYAGLRDLLPHVLGRVYHRQGGGELRVERALVDSGDEAKAVYEAVRESEFGAVLTPSKGFGRTTTSRGVGEWRPRPGERAGYHWRLTAGEYGRQRAVQYDPDPWKSQLYGILTTPPGAGTALKFWGDDPRAHEMVSEHCAGESAEPQTVRGTTFDKWTRRPHRPDNHLWDCLVLAAVAASAAGLQWSPTGRPVPVPQQSGTVKLSDLQARKHGSRLNELRSRRIASNSMVG